MRTISEGQQSAQRILREVPPARRTEPSLHLYQGMKYIPAAQMEVRVPVDHYSKPMFALYGVRA